MILFDHSDDFDGVHACYEQCHVDEEADDGGNKFNVSLFDHGQDPNVTQTGKKGKDSEDYIPVKDLFHDASVVLSRKPHFSNGFQQLLLDA